MILAAARRLYGNNYVSKIVPAWQSRCTRFRFSPLPLSIKSRIAWNTSPRLKCQHDAGWVPSRIPNMLKLLCVVVGGGSPFPINVKKSNTVHCDANEIQLYLALKDRTWLSAEVAQPAKGNPFTLPLYVKPERKMEATKKLSKFFTGGEYPKYCDDDIIHVVVVVPEGAHLFRNTYLAFPMMQISDIDDVRNDLLLFQPLKDAFDLCHISFIYSHCDDSFYLKLFDPSIRNTPLIDLMRDPKQRQVLMDAISRAKEPCKYDPRTTFGDLEGQALKFTSLNRPYNRCLNLQARLAYGTAWKQQNIVQTYDLHDFWTEGGSLEDNMSMFRQSIEDCDQV
ncbi:hypothetical protein AC1031_014198 [Aphanomyces cochlioides]|nr:hypothetical protein AC1031_014198 [Aphanomyces cochlioides]